jgi:hypothetical protein
MKYTTHYITLHPTSFEHVVQCQGLQKVQLLKLQHITGVGYLTRSDVNS